MAALKRAAGASSLALAAGLLALNVALNVPLFRPGETPYRDSIEGGYAGMARFFAEHPNPWGWNPTQYGGLSAQFTYLPGLPYTAGMISRVAGIEPDYAYRILAAAFACLGPATLFWFVLYFTRSRWWALGVGLAYTFCSPSYYLVHTIDLDRGKAFLPWRLQVLVKYGEGPHNAGLTMLPLALMALWHAAASPGFAPVFVAAMLLAAVTLTNWVAALALACCCLLMLLTLAGSGLRPARALAAAALAYGLACFWLTPSFIRTIAFNWPADAFDYQLLGPQRLLLAGLPALVLLLDCAVRRIFPGERYLRFVALNFVAFAWVVLWFYTRGFNTVPESRRYALEMEMFLLLLLFELFRQILRAPIAPLRFFGVYAAVAIFLSGWGQVRRFSTQGFDDRNPAPREGFIEYRAAERLAALHPRGRVFASGGLRFRLNSWFPIAQVGGGFESGLRNRAPLNAAYQIRTGSSGADAIRELAALGVEYVVVHGPNSREQYRDFKNPRKFEGLLEAVWREEDDVIYRVPFTSLAHLAGTPATLPVTWLGSSEMRVEGAIPADSVVSLQVNYDPGWTAFQDGRQIAIGQDGLGFMVLHANPSQAARIELQFRSSLEQRLMAAVSALCWLGSLAALVLPRTGGWTPRSAAGPQASLSATPQ